MSLVQINGRSIDSSTYLGKLCRSSVQKSWCRECGRRFYEPIKQKIYKMASYWIQIIQRFRDCSLSHYTHSCLGSQLHQCHVTRLPAGENNRSCLHILHSCLKATFLQWSNNIHAMLSNVIHLFIQCDVINVIHLLSNCPIRQGKVKFAKFVCMSLKAWIQFCWYTV